NTAQFLFFLITLFWRIPKTDFAAGDLMNRANITSSQIDPEEIRANPAFRKIERAALSRHHIHEIVNHGRKGKKAINIHQSTDDIFVIGDNPLLFKRIPTLFSEFNEIDFLIAISSNRIYSSTNEVFLTRSQKNWVNYNAAIIDQSERYIASGNEHILRKSVEYFKEIESRQLKYRLAEMTFDVK
ncbi:MAG: hypothetical protein RIB86_20050, partial [Imperialibacter sp.]